MHSLNVEDKYDFDGVKMNTKTMIAMALSSVLAVSTVYAKPSGEMKFHAQSCETTKTDKGCSEYNVKFPVYLDDKWVNEYIDKNVRSIVSDGSVGAQLPWQKFIQHYADISTQVDGDDVWTQDITVDVKDSGQLEHWIAVTFTTYEYNKGAAHGMPGRYYRVLDAKAKKEIKLDDILLPGKDKREALEKLQYQAAKQYFIKHADMSAAEVDAQFSSQMFEFHLTDNWRPVKDGLVFGFGAYEIGPYALGMPEVFINMKDLKGIIDKNALKKLSHWPVAHKD